LLAFYSPSLFLGSFLGKYMGSPQIKSWTPYRVSNFSKAFGREARGAPKMGPGLSVVIWVVWNNPS